MPIDASRNPYDSPGFDPAAGKAVPTDEPGKSELDDDLDDALDDLGAGAKGPVDEPTTATTSTSPARAPRASSTSTASTAT